MATRNLTKKFEGVRAQCRLSAISARTNRDGQDGLLEDHDDSSATHHTGLPLTSALPPKWVDVSDEVHEDIVKAKEAIAALHDLHSRRLKVSFGEDESAQEAAIDDATARVTGILRGAENKIKQIALIGNDGSQQLSKAECDVRLNVMRSLGMELAALFKAFRGGQKEYLNKLKAQQSVGNDLFRDVNDAGARGGATGNFDDALDHGLSEEQVMQLRELEQRSDEREKEIIHLVQSINDLASLFQELSVLVIEQGTVLDRIDYNVEQTLVRMKEANVQLTQADDYSKKTHTLKCIAVLIVVIIIELIVLASKHA